MTAELLGRLPEADPLMLPWLARHVRAADLPLIARAAGALCPVLPHDSWPVVTDAVVQALARRGEEVTGHAIALLPPLAALLPGRATTPDALGYAALGGEIGEPPALPAHWSEITAALERGRELPPLSHLALLARLASGRLVGLTAQELVYLGPHLPERGDSWGEQALDAVEDALLNNAGWYACALAARAVPYLSGRDRDKLRLLARRHPSEWTDHLAVMARDAEPHDTADGEVLSAHPRARSLLEVEAGSDTLADACALLTERVVERYGRVERWSPDFSRPRPGTEPRRRRDRITHRFPVERQRYLGEATVRWVGCGFADPDAPANPRSADLPLRPDRPYTFWFNIGEQVEGALDTAPFELPASAEPGTELVVVLYSFPGELEIDRAADTGTYVLMADGSVRVTHQPGGGPVGGQRLFFPVRAPSTPGRHRLRCHLYCKGTLMQSRLVEAEVTETVSHRPRALSSVLDYVTDSALDPGQLAALPELKLSVFINDNDEDTHGFRFFVDGVTQIRGDSPISSVVLGSMIKFVRDGLRQASWGSTAPFDLDEHTYRYHPDDAHRSFAHDLVELAKLGYDLWVTVGSALSVDIPSDETRAPNAILQELMREPGLIEVAAKAEIGEVLPAAAVYDYPLDADLENLTVCEAANRAIEAGANLAEQPCAHGRCPSYWDESVVCPSGFWGFRHAIALPQSRQSSSSGHLNQGVRPVHVIRNGDEPLRVIVAISQEYDGVHPQEVGRRGGMASPCADRAVFLSMLRREGSNPHLLYFFGHGIEERGIPKLQIGPTGSNLRYSKIADGFWRWSTNHPLVFLNGCGTTAVEPKHAANFVHAFIRQAGAAGVIGTEISVFEWLATAFADHFLRHFIDEGLTVAAAMRAARLDLLADRNPLGLVYVAYAQPQLRL